MKKLVTTILPISLLLIAIVIIGSSCNGEPVEDDPQETCDSGISYKIDGNLVSFDNDQVTAEIHNDAAIGKFYDIWTDQGNGFYFHSTITETGETCGYARDWFTVDDVANITFLNDKDNVDMTFKVEQGANDVGDHVKITFHGSYLKNGTVYQITEGVICTSIDAVN
ncbi:MAG TPA: hypothetical protein ENK64_02085 [Flavobacteriales bacterium]|jgi:hypothetical protein|nr:hypothetical protein [Flavobacteriales bacterium]